MTLTVTPGCPTSYTDVSDPANPQIVYVSQAAQALCIAREQMMQGNFGGAAWATLQSLEEESQALVNNLLHLLPFDIGPFLAAAVNDFLNRVRQFLNWLRGLLGSGMMWLLAIAGGALVVYAVASDNDNERRGHERQA